MADLPQAVVTFLFTDVEGSTALWEDAPDTMMDALRVHDEIIDAASAANDGVAVKPRGEGDSRFIVFPSAHGAVAAAADVQRGLASAVWPTPRPIRVRVSLHTGAADLQMGDYYGSSVNRAARLRSIAHGGQIVMSRSTWELVQDDLPADVAITDMGEHRLKDLTRPERVYQLDVGGLDEGFPLLTSLDVSRTNLPVQLTDFVGREAELDDVKGIIGRSRMVTLLAPGGGGKTRLAVQAAADLVGDFPDGVFFIDLAPVSSVRDVPQAVAEALGATLAGADDPRAQLVAHLANDRLLLAFDNLEHLGEAADLVTDVLRGAQDVKVIATSRAKLNITGETVYTLPGLETSWATPEEAFGASGAHLFVDAAKRTDPSLSLAAGDLDALARILDVVGGMPLGILLAAAWVDALRIDEISEEIARSADFLETEMRDVPERQRSMRAVFDYSWSMLGEDDRATFAGLSVFRGGFTRTAAQQVAGASLRGLTNLVGKSLLVSDRESGRYTVHELLRQYAEEELRKDPRAWAKAIEDHTAFYAGLGASASDDLFLPRDQKRALETIEADLDNVRSALRHALGPVDALQARRFVIVLAFLYEVRGWVKAAFDLMTEIVEALEEVKGDEAAETMHALALAYQAKLMTNLGHPSVAGPLAAKATERLKNSSDSLAYLMAIEVLCENKMYAGDLDGVLELSLEAIRLADDEGIEVFSAGMRTYEAFVHMQRGDIETAVRRLEEGDEVLARDNEHLMRTRNFEARALIAMMEGRLQDAVALRDRQIELARHVGYVRAVALSYQGLASAHHAAGELHDAKDAYFESLTIFEQMGNVTDMASILVHLARVNVEAGDLEPAAELLSCVLNDSRKRAATPRRARRDRGRRGSGPCRNRKPARRRPVCSLARRRSRQDARSRCQGAAGVKGALAAARPPAARVRARGVGAVFPTLRGVRVDPTARGRPSRRTRSPRAAPIAPESKVTVASWQGSWLRQRQRRRRAKATPIGPNIRRGRENRPRRRQSPPSSESVATIRARTKRRAARRSRPTPVPQARSRRLRRLPLPTPRRALPNPGPEVSSGTGSSTGGDRGARREHAPQCQAPERRRGRFRITQRHRCWTPWRPRSLHRKGARGCKAHGAT